MSIKRIVLVSVVFALMVAGQTVALAQQKVTIEGRVQYLESTALPADATLWLTLEDAATGVDLISLEKEGVVDGNPQPYPFTMEIEASRVVASARYRVVAEITSTQQRLDRLYAGTSAPFTISTTGKTTVPPFRALYQPGRLGGAGSGALWILAAIACIVLWTLIAILRRARTRSLSRQLA